MSKVLVVEDDLEINELVGEYLGLENIGYLQATTGQTGIQQALTQHPDAVILDLMLPDIEGFEVAKTLSMKRATYDIPIVILTCRCGDEERRRGFASGALYYMNKPFLPDDLLGTLREAMAWREGLATREPAGTIPFGQSASETGKATHQLIADLFAHTSLEDRDIARIREAIESLDASVRQWNAQHPVKTEIKLEFRIEKPAAGPAILKLTLSEKPPKFLADALNKKPGSPPSPLAPFWSQWIDRLGITKYETNLANHQITLTRQL